MDAAAEYHRYELVFDERGLHRKVAFEAADRSALFTEHCRVGGAYEIVEDGICIGRASYDEQGGFWVLHGQTPA